MAEEIKEGIIATRLAAAEAQISKSPYPPFPETLMFEITNACNHSCVFCGNSKMKRKRGFIGAGLFGKLALAGFNLGARNLALYMGGESTLDKRLPDFVQTAKGIGYNYIYLTTNGSADLSFYQTLVQAGLHSLKFSINGITRETYKSIHGKDYLDRALGNLQSLNRWRKENPFRLLASFIYTELTQGEQKAAQEIMSPLVDDLYIAPAGGKMGIPCSLLWSRLHITWEGYLTICCVDFENDLVVCDLNKMGLKDAWHHPGFVEMRRCHLSRELDGTLCQHCKEYNGN